MSALRRRTVLGALVILGALTAPARGAVPHTVAPGETLWSIAAASNFTTRSLAAFNGLSEDSNVVLGSTIMIPSVPEAAAALQRAGLVTAPMAGTSGTTSTSSSSPAPMGAYIVRPGDTLSELAARSRVPVAQVAAMNGLPVDAKLIAGTGLKLPSGSPIAAPIASQPPETVVRPAAPSAPPYPTPVRLSPYQVGSIAAQNGAPPSLTAAIASMESGFNNAMVSPASARGIMQIMPGTWNWVQQNLSAGPLDPHSAADNVRAGSLYINRLLRQTGGNVPLAVAGYYQGLGSVLHRGMFDDTKHYVATVLALQKRFGG